MYARTGVVSLFIAFAAVAGACGPPPTAPAPAGPGPLSLGNGDVYGNGAATAASISANGDLVAFSSEADNLVAGDDNGTTDTFLRNRLNGSVERVAETTVGEPRISANGRFVSYVAFGGTYGVYDRVTGTHTTWTTAVAQNTPVVPDDGTVAIYGRTSSLGAFATACVVRDLATGNEVDCPHLGSGFGTVALDAVSRNGRHVLYHWRDQDGGGTSGRFVWDRVTGTTTPAPADLVVFGSSVALSDDGRHIAATDLTPGSPWSPRLFDLRTETVETLPGPPPDGATMPLDLTADGRVVALYSEATNLDPADTNTGPDIYLWDTVADNVTLASRHLDTGAGLPSGATLCGHGPGQILASGEGVCVLSPDALLPEDTNGVLDAWLAPG